MGSASSRVATAPARRGPLRRLRLWRPRVALLLTALVFIPGSVLGVQLRDDLQAIADEEATSAELVRQTQYRLDAIAVEAALADERNWVIINEAVSSFGVDPVLVTEVLGVDLVAQLEIARANVDRFLLNDTLGVADDVADLREGTRDIDALGTDYAALEAQIRDLGTTAAAELVELSSATRNGERVRTQLAFVESSAVALRSVQGEHVGLFAAQFQIGGGEPAEAIAQLVRSRSEYEAVIAELVVDAPPSLLLDLEQVIRADAVVAIQMVSDDLIDSTLSEGLEADPDGVLAASADLATTGALFNDSIAAIDEWLTFTLAAGEELTATTIQINEATAVAATEKTMQALGVGGLTILALLLVTRLIVSPIRLLAAAAHSAQAGDPVNLRPSGPAEVHLAGEVVGELAGNLELATVQALALARGDLEDPNLLTSAPGRIGESLNRAVDTLAESIREREDFRVRLAHQADHDGLTGVPNRNATVRYLGDALDEAEEAQTSVAVLYIDLDGFKPINDLHGHRSGDELLTASAKRLNGVLRLGDFVGRLGGDEFVLIAPGIEGPDAAVSLAHRVRMELTEPVELSDGTLVSVGASIGVAMAGSGDSPGSVLHDADLALYAAKATGRNTVEFCTETMRLEAAESIDLTTAISAGLERGEFTLMYQPIVNADGRVESMESLIRWRRDGVMVAPGSFIPFAERSDLIIDIDQWVVKEAVRQLAAWTDHPVLGSVALAVNISRRHLGDAGFVDRILGPLTAAGVDPRRLEVEVTETALLEHEEEAARKLATLRAEGVRVAIDDFGTGYTGLGHLQTMPVDVIKIDRGFVTHVADEDSSDAVLIRLIVEAGHQLGAQITAEGVERPEQAEMLRKLGSDRMQGFYFARPTPIEDISALVTEVREQCRADRASDEMVVVAGPWN